LRDRLAGLAGRTFTHVHLDEGYWHLEARLRDADANVTVFFSHEHNAGKCLDVFPIDFAAGDEPIERAWRPLAAALQVRDVDCLWRDEWIVRGSDAPRATPQSPVDGIQPLPDGLVGDDPHTLLAGPAGVAPAHAVASARVLAGLVFRGDGQLLVVVASDRAPLNVEVLQGADAEALLAEYGATPAVQP
jgi:hypothetical protein